MNKEETIEELQKELDELQKAVDSLIEERDRYREALEECKCYSEQALRQSN